MTIPGKLYAVNCEVTYSVHVAILALLMDISFFSVEQISAYPRKVRGDRGTENKDI